MKRFKPDFNKKYWVVVVAVVTAGISTLFSMSIEFETLESKFYDLRLKLSHAPKEDPSIALITLDPATSEAVREFAPLSLGQHSRLLHALNDYSPKGIGYLVPLSSVRSAHTDQWDNPVIMASFLSQVEKLKQTGIPVIFGTTFSEGSELVPPYPLSFLPHALSTLSLDQSFLSDDKNTKLNILSLHDKQTLLPELVKMTGNSATPIGYSNDSVTSTKYQLFRYHGDIGHAYPRYSMIDVIEKRVPVEKLNNKILLIGTAFPDNPKDFVLIPKMNGINRVSALEAQANMLDSLINQDGIERMSTNMNTVFAFAVTLVTLLLVSLLTPGRAILSSTLWNFSFFIFGWIAFHYPVLGPTGSWIEIATPLMGSIIGCFVVFPYRWLREYRKRYQIEQKNKLLMQVEELKNNFMSLVTHDLKTPVAKIQGLAEVVLSKATDRLNDRDKESIRSIITSSDELNHFISSILELHNIDSNRLVVRFVSKDINQLIEECVQRFKAPARSKNIKIQTNLEPLFPIKIDSEQITKVLNNLVDNAIKYSPEGSVLSIRSTEVDHFVRIEIEDQGVGMSDTEMKSLFSRFYRANNDATTRNIGTGLGLYLVKYFVEQIHHGTVSVTSKQGLGSTFIITLPIEQKHQSYAPGLSIELLENPGKKSIGEPSDV